MKAHLFFDVRACAVAAAVSIAGLVPVLSFGAPLPPVFVFHDDFSSAVSEVTLLNGTHPTGSSVQWNASSNLGFRKSGSTSAVVARDDISYVGWIPLIAANGMGKMAGRITVDATLRPAPAEGKQNWVAIGFGSIPEKRNILWAHGVFAFVNSKGLYEILLSSTGEAGGLIKLQSGEIPDVSVGDAPIAVPVRLVYDQVGHTLSLTVNGQSVMRDYAMGDEHHFTPSMQAVGFSGFAQKSDAPLLTDFSVSLSK